MERLRKAESYLVRAEGAGIVLLLSVMILLSFWQVAQRQLFGTGLLWADTLLRHLVVVVGFLGAGVAAAEGKHFGFELFSHAKGRTGASLRLVSNVAGALVSGLLAKASWHYYLDERGSTLFTAGGVTVPASWFAITIPVGFILVLVHLSVGAAAAAAELREPAK